MKLIFCAVLLFLPLEGVTAPTWTRINTLTRQGTILTVVCQGEGPSQAQARKDALNSCRATAAEQANNNFKVNSTYIQTEKDHGFQEEVSSNKIVEDLPCTPKDEFWEEKGEIFTEYLKCEFNLGKAKIKEAPEEQKPEAAEAQQLILTIIPVGDSLLIEGRTPRIIPIKDNPMGLSINSGDSVMVVRKAGYMPKRIPLKNLPDKLEVQLDSF